RCAWRRGRDDVQAARRSPPRRGSPQPDHRRPQRQTLETRRVPSRDRGPRPARCRPAGVRSERPVTEPDLTNLQPTPPKSEPKTRDSENGPPVLSGRTVNKSRELRLDDWLSPEQA